MGQTPEQDAADRALRNHLHNLAIAIYEGKQGYDAAIAAGDTGRAAQWLQSVRDLRAMFQNVAGQFTANNPHAIGIFDQWILVTGEWVAAAAGALGAGVGTLVTIPRVVLDEVVTTIGGTASGLAWQGVRVLVPVLIVGAGLLWLLREAEKSPTVRRTVKRYV